MICITLTGRTIEEDLQLFWRNRQYIDAAELRLDMLDTSDVRQLNGAKDFPQNVDLPVILTCRRKADGGFFEGSERKRLSIISCVSLGQFSWCDLESDVRKPELESSLSQRGIKIIRSMHFNDCIPGNLFTVVSRLASKGDIPKVAVMPKTTADLITLFNCEKELSFIKQKIIVGMGSFGLCTRILYKKTGSMLTYCSEDCIMGQISPRDMKELYRADRVNQQTRIYGVIGNPIAHSVSPNIHNPGFVGIRFNAIYVPFLVDNVRMFFRLAELLRINGFSVTIPHKQDVLPFLGKTTREVNQTGSCNTVIRENNYWKGSNTDYYGFLRLVSMGIEKQKFRSAIVIGAGGGARAVVWALRNHRVNVTILNRTVEKARIIAAETMSQYDSLENAANYCGKADLIIQTTSVGMAPDNNSDPAPALTFTGKETVCDLIYKPHQTHFLRRAEESGCTIIHGIDFLLEQGKLQFEVFSGYHYPPNIHPDF